MISKSPFEKNTCSYLDKKRNAWKFSFLLIFQFSISFCPLWNCFDHHLPLTKFTLKWVYGGRTRSCTFRHLYTGFSSLISEKRETLFFLRVSQFSSGPFLGPWWHGHIKRSVGLISSTCPHYHVGEEKSFRKRPTW